MSFIKKVLGSISRRILTDPGEFTGDIFVVVYLSHCMGHCDRPPVGK